MTWAKFAIKTGTANRTYDLDVWDGLTHWTRVRWLTKVVVVLGDISCCAGFLGCVFVDGRVPACNLRSRAMSFSLLHSHTAKLTFGNGDILKRSIKRLSYLS